MTQVEIISRLKEPFTSKEIEWKIQTTTQDKVRGMAVAYVDSRAIQKRLDETVGAFNWQNTYMPWQEKSQVCGLSIYCEDRKEWVTKFDGAENTDFEPIKGGLSDAFKRAASLWGIGRYLYDIDGIWVEIEQKGKSYSIKDEQQKKLETSYNNALAKIFAVSPAIQTGNNGGMENKGQMPPVQQPAKNEQPPAQQSNPQNQMSATGIYTVQSLKPSGTSSQLVELVKDSGEIIKAYAKNDDALKVGACFTNVSIEEIEGKYGLYNRINAYELAA